MAIFDRGDIESVPQDVIDEAISRLEALLD